MDSTGWQDIPEFAELRQLGGAAAGGRPPFGQRRHIRGGGVRPGQTLLRWGTRPFGPLEVLTISLVAAEIYLRPKI
eukprot:scaffold14881_cov30-Prasinocladus_malaysianus.AAC.2